MGKIVLDSNVVIYLSKGLLTIEDLLSFVECDSLEIWISLVTYMEVLSYEFQSFEEENFVKNLLHEFFILDIDKDVADKTIEIRKKYKIKLPDAIICASAVTIDAHLITADTQLKKVKEANVKIITPF